MSSARCGGATEGFKPLRQPIPARWGRTRASVAARRSRALSRPAIEGLRSGSVRVPLNNRDHRDAQ